MRGWLLWRDIEDEDIGVMWASAGSVGFLCVGSRYLIH